MKGDCKMNTVEPIKNKKSLKQIENILNNKKSKRDLLIFVLGINTGLRISDILALNVGDVKNKEFIRLIEQKTGKIKQFPLNNKVKGLIKIFTKKRKHYEPLFRTKFRNRMERTSAYRMIKNICKKAGVKSYIGTHTLRKTFGYHHYKKFKDVAILQKIFNHSSQEITLRYIGVEQDEINDSYLNFEL